MFDLNICFSHLLGRPASISAMNTAEGKNNAIIIIIIIIITIIIIIIII